MRIGRPNRDINDDEIRIILSHKNGSNSKPLKRLIILVCSAIVLALVVALISLNRSNGDDTVKFHEVDTPELSHIPDTGTIVLTKPVVAPSPYVERKDTTVNSIGLVILTPVNATASLVMGNDIDTDSTAVLVAQAADIRADNGKIVGTFVAQGELKSKGDSKSGFCSIIGDEISIGVADATPKFEEALESDGYFFRQYPLVVSGQVIENKPKGKSIRKALAENNGIVSVIVSTNRLTFHDFSQALVDAGVRNAIYLVGGDSYGCYIGKTGEAFTFGNKWYTDNDNVNYIVWR